MELPMIGMMNPQEEDDCKDVCLMLLFFSPFFLENTKAHPWQYERSWLWL